MSNKLLFTLLSAGLLLAGCGTQDTNPSDTTSDAQFSTTNDEITKADTQWRAEQNKLMERLNDTQTSDDALVRAAIAKGGFDALANFVYTSSEEDVANFFNKFGIAYTVGSKVVKPTTISQQDIVDVKPLASRPKLLPIPSNIDSFSEEGKISAQSPEACVKTFPLSDRGQFHRLNPLSSQVVFIDVFGRPSWTSKLIWKLGGGNRDDCQGEVGKWGKPGDVGGHMIADSFDGYGQRLNLYPQDSNFNVSAWAIVENTVRRCINTGPQLSTRQVIPVFMYVNLDFPGLGIRPDKVTASIGLPFNNYQRSEATFENAPRVAKNATEAARLQDEVIANGCKGPVRP